MHLSTFLRLSRSLLSAFLTVALSSSLVACGGGGGGGGGADQTNPLELVVDANTGSDDGLGTTNEPFKTITHALSVVSPGGTIHVRIGAYDNANGEVFPLQLPSNVTLAGPASALITGTRPMIVGIGAVPTDIGTNESATLIAGVGSTISLLHLMVPTAAPGINSVIAAPFPSATISSCVIEGGIIGIKIMNSALALTIRRSKVTGAQIGILFNGAGHGSLVERTMTRSNVTGVYLDGIVVDLDLGGGAQGGAGRNEFAGNAEVDLFISNGNTVTAQNNFWDATPSPAIYLGSNPPLGVDIWLRGNQATVDASGALSTPPTGGGPIGLPPPTDTAGGTSAP